MDTSETYQTRRSALILSLVLILLAGTAPYLAGLRHGFVYDDHGQIEENVFLRNPAHVKDVLALKTIDQPAIINGRRPLILLSYFSDLAVWGGRPFGFRVTNLLFHVATGWLLFFLLLRLAAADGMKRGRVVFGFVGAVLFVLHPVVTEAVHVAAFRPDVFYTFFLLLYLLAGSALRDPGWRRYAGVAVMLVSLVLSLGAKEAAVVAPPVLFGMWLCFPGARPGKVLQAVVLTASAAIVCVYVFLCSRGSSFQAATGVWNGLSLKFPVNLWTMPWLWLRYLVLLLAPFPLVADRIVTPVNGPFHLRFIVGTVVLVASLAVLFRWRKIPWLSFGLGLILAAFLPVSNLVPLFNPFAERYMYLMAAGWAFFLARCLAYGGLGNGPGRMGRIVWFAMLCTAYLTIGLMRIGDWADDLTLWSQTLRDEPRSARAHTWVGLELKRSDHLEEALEHFALATKLNPQDVTALVNRGIIYGQSGDLAEAERAMRLAVERRPDKPSAHWNLAVTYQMQGKSYDALMETEEVLRLDPMHTRALQAKIVLLIQRELYGEALETADRLLEVEPQNPEGLAAKRYLEQQAGATSRAKD